MDRRSFLATTCGALTWGSGNAVAQLPIINPRIGVLISAAAPHPFSEGFARGMSRLGHFEGRNVAIDWRYTEGHFQRAAEHAKELAANRVDIIVAHFTPAVKAAIAATSTIPIIMAPAGAPLQLGFIRNLARPEGNVTGLSGMDAEIGGKRLALLKDTFRNLHTVGVLAATASTDPIGTPYVADIAAAGASSNIRIVPVLIDNANGIPKALEQMAEAKAQAVIVQGLFEPYRNMIIELATRHRMGVMGANRETAVAGGLISFSANFGVLYEKAAEYVDKIIKGARVADLPVQQPTTFNVILNAHTMKALDLEIGPILEAQVDEIID
jgi:putative tryptophan/tyrosine transport system substrate-binding protein